ncbi:MAG: hypothetical protein ACRCTY_05085 [Candidatus Adiutrix sp.]
MRKVMISFFLVIGLFFYFGVKPIQAQSDCRASHETGKRKMEQEKRKTQESQEENHPDPEETEAAFDLCLGGIGGIGGFGGGFGGFPSPPSYEDIINQLCREARKQVLKRVGGYSSFYNDLVRGNNKVIPSDGQLNRDIWDALNN